MPGCIKCVEYSPMHYSQNLQHGFPDTSISQKFEALSQQLSKAAEQIKNWQTSGQLPILSLPAQTSDIDELKAIADNFRSSFDHVVILGTGGSSLGGQTLVDIKKSLFKADSPTLHFLDNVDPDTFIALFNEVPIAQTGFIIISKSGTTAETMSSFILCLEHAKQANLPLKKHFLLITEPGQRPLRSYGEQYGLNILDHDPKIGGRFSVLSLVGLLPAMIAGLDAKAVRRGAADVLNSFNADAAPCIGAAWSVAHAGDFSQTVLMPYLDRLASFGLWFRQLWAESLGKDGKGITPIRAMGTVDQHSQVQLYLGGENNRLFTVIGLADAPKNDLVLPAVEDNQLEYLTGRTLGNLLLAEQQATTDALVNNNRPVRTITFNQLNEETIGALFMHYMLETMVAAQLMNIDAFDQPAVEEGKILTKQYMQQGSSYSAKPSVSGMAAA